MRQILSVRFVAALAALAALAFGVTSVFAGDDDDSTDGIAAGGAAVDDGADVPQGSAVATSVPFERRIDLIELVESFERSEDFAIGPDGLTTGIVDMVLDERRVVRVAPGTPGQIDCGNLRNANRCVVLADLLGDAVIWFAVEPRGPRDTVRLGPIVDLQDGNAIFENGWQIPYPPVIERDCDDELDVTSFSDFLRRFGPGSTSVVDLETRMVTEVVCGPETVPESTTDTVAETPTDTVGETPIDTATSIATDAAGSGVDG